jgi:N-acetylmuramoyl-L-alanine amidase
MTRGLSLIPALVFSSVALQAGSLQVKAVRAWSFPDITRVAIEVSGDFTYKSDRAHHPERIFFDLKGAVPAIHGKHLLKKEIGGKLLKSVRVAETQPGVTRVVLDLAAAVEFTASQLTSPDRLIVELHAPSAQPVPPTVISTAPSVVAQPRVAVMPETTSPESTQIAENIKQQLPSPPVILPNAHGADVELTRSLTRALGLKVNRIVIDAGHGGHDRGTAGPGGLLEKDLVLDVALRLGKLVEQRLGAEVIYTRNDDTFVPLQERTAIANRNHADLFLSIHANSSVAHEVAGVETYYLNFTNSPEAMNTAARENASSDKSVFELKDLIQKISLHDKIEESKQFAESVQTSMQAFTNRSFPSARNRGVRKAPFVVLIGASMPSVLAEVGFLTNTRQEAMLSKPEYRQKLAEALFRGVQRYTQTLSHFEVAQQDTRTSDNSGTR